MLLTTAHWKLIRRWSMVLGVILGLWPTLALACTQPPPGVRRDPSTTADRVNAAQIVFEGTVIGGQQSGSTGPIYTATIEVHQYFKGVDNKIVTVDGFGDGASCRASVKVGDQRFFFIQVGPDGQWHGSYQHGGPIAMVTPEMVTEILNAVGKPPVPPRDQTTTPTSQAQNPDLPRELPATNQGSNFLIWWVVLGLGCLSAGIWLRRKYFKSA
ncbi:hypothetical protein [Herpetosiphon llansteffanensis]|uniref:hypothetical protein n=1 Tax=Herpetosiphon llansteffanensis TaxID=2094568 RepID=UPI000D7B99A5|nr:hypothetical protein [Herpetosiphon llansteffanensis]